MIIFIIRSLKLNQRETDACEMVDEQTDRQWVSVLLSPMATV